jgi:hypothetical protein
MILDIKDTEFEVIQDIAERKKKGLSKYGTSVAQNPLVLREWLQHQYEELLDAAIYCKRAIQEIDNAEKKD